jgi:putative tricarboxylic transport membrane protein
MKLNPVTFVATHPDRISGAVLAIAGAFFLLASSHLPFGTLSAPDSGFFPRSLATALLLAGLVILVRAFNALPEIFDFSKRTWGVALAIAMLFLYGALLEQVGFLICTAAILFVLMTFYGGLGWKLSALIALPSVVATYLGFLELGVALPAGVFARF